MGNFEVVGTVQMKIALSAPRHVLFLLHAAAYSVQAG